mmetsp:Transcript_18601/g.52525  ORF Transcript_18601/g.52525 Transcript_18601/m.52525 type:complete len:853 (+) Transcript_18601:2599-5157(+)
MGIVRLASLGTGIISAITPDWVANKLWQPILRSVEDAIVKENQCNPIFILKEVSLASDLADYVTRAGRRQVERETLLHGRRITRMARRFVVQLSQRAERMRAELSASPGVTHHGYLLRFGTTDRFDGRPVSPLSRLSPRKALEVAKNVSEFIRMSSASSGSADESLGSRTSPAQSSKEWIRVYVVLGGGRLREYKTLRAARDDVLNRFPPFSLTAQRGFDVKAARVIQPRARKEWCVQLEVQGLMKPEEMRIYACATENSRRMWAEHARAAAKTPSGIGIQSALGQTGQTLQRGLNLRLGNFIPQLPIGFNQILVGGRVEEASCDDAAREAIAARRSRPPSPIFVCAFSQDLSAPAAAATAVAAASAAATSSTANVEAARSSAATARECLDCDAGLSFPPNGCTSAATGTAWAQRLPLPPASPGAKSSGRSANKMSAVLDPGLAFARELSRAADTSRRIASLKMSSALKWAQEQVSETSWRLSSRSNDSSSALNTVSPRDADALVEKVNEAGVASEEASGGATSQNTYNVSKTAEPTSWASSGDLGEGDDIGQRRRNRGWTPWTGSRSKTASSHVQPASGRASPVSGVFASEESSQPSIRQVRPLVEKALLSSCSSSHAEERRLDERDAPTTPAREPASKRTMDIASSSSPSWMVWPYKGNDGKTWTPPWSSRDKLSIASTPAPSGGRASPISEISSAESSPSPSRAGELLAEDTPEIELPSPRDPKTSRPPTPISSTPYAKIRSSHAIAESSTHHSKLAANIRARAAGPIGYLSPDDAVAIVHAITKATPMESPPASCREEDGGFDDEVASSSPASMRQKLPFFTIERDGDGTPTKRMPPPVPPPLVRSRP